MIIMIHLVYYLMMVQVHLVSNKKRNTSFEKLFLICICCDYNFTIMQIL